MTNYIIRVRIYRCSAKQDVDDVHTVLQQKTPILSGKTENIGVCSYGLVDYDSRADRYVVVNPVDVVVLHAYTAVRNRIAAAEVIFGAGAGIAQAGVERVAGARIEAYNRTNRVITGGPACLQLVADGGHADRSRGGGRWLKYPYQKP